MSTPHRKGILPEWGYLPSWLVRIRGLSPGHWRVLLALAARYNRLRKQCMPSIATIARDTGDPERDVRRALNELSEAGVIVRVQRLTESGRRTSDNYSWPPQAPVFHDLRQVVVRRRRPGAWSGDDAAPEAHDKSPPSNPGARSPGGTGGKDAATGGTLPPNPRGDAPPMNRISQQRNIEQSDYVTGCSPQVGEFKWSLPDLRKYAVRLAAAEQRQAGLTAEQQRERVAEIIAKAPSGEIILVGSIDEDVFTDESDVPRRRAAIN